MHLLFPCCLLVSAAWCSITYAASPETEARVSGWLKAWDSQGIHRTGTPGDEAGAAWIAREATSFGGSVTSESFQLDRIDPISAYVEFEGVRINGEPLFDGPD